MDPFQEPRRGMDTTNGKIKTVNTAPVTNTTEPVKTTTTTIPKTTKIQAEILDHALKTQDIEQSREYLQTKLLPFKAGSARHSCNKQTQLKNDS